MRWSSLILAALVAGATALAFIRPAGYGLVNLDDYAYAETYEGVTGGLGAGAVRWAFEGAHENIYMPLTWLSYAADWSLGGERRVHRVMHLHSIALHALNAVLVFLLLMAVLRCGPCVAAAGALLWALHPLRVESVAWIASRKDVLSMAFLLCALHAWVRFRLDDSGRWYAVSMLCFVCGALAKPSVMSFPFLALTLDFFFLRRTELRAALSDRAYLLPLAAFVVLTAYTKTCQDAGVKIFPELAGAPFGYRVLNAAVSYGVYLIETVFPANLAPQCMLRYPDLPRMCAPALTVAAAAACCAGLSLRRRGAFAAGLAWYSFAVAPMLGLAGFGFHSAADRFTYIPAVGLSFAAAAGLARLKGRAARICAGVACGAVLAALAAVTIRQSGYWENDLKLFSRTLEVDGEENVLAQFNVGGYLWEHDHDLERAERHFRKGRAKYPRNAYSGMNGALQIMTLCELGRREEAARVLHEASELEKEHGAGLVFGDGFLAARGLYFLLFIGADQMRDDLAVIERSTASSLHGKYLRAFLRLQEEGERGYREAVAELLASRGRIHRRDCLQYRFLERSGPVPRRQEKFQGTNP